MIDDDSSEEEEELVLNEDEYLVLLECQGLHWDEATKVTAWDTHNAAEEAAAQYYEGGSYPGGAVHALVRDHQGITVQVELILEWDPRWDGHELRYDHPRHCTHEGKFEMKRSLEKGMIAPWCWLCNNQIGPSVPLTKDDPP